MRTEIAADEYSLTGAAIQRHLRSNRTSPAWKPCPSPPHGGRMLTALAQYHNAVNEQLHPPLSLLLLSAYIRDKNPVLLFSYHFDKTFDTTYKSKSRPNLRNPFTRHRLRQAQRPAWVLVTTGIPNSFSRGSMISIVRRAAQLKKSPSAS